ncbi:MAG: HEAT repeat domain-containing protein [Myxococcales bacterium]|nr:HEAT repeat domain-containing protein [Myxococcales bacterium]
MKHLIALILALGLIGAATALVWAQESPCADDDAVCWLEKLKGDDAVAMRAAIRLGALQSKPAIPLLIKKLESKDQYMSTAALNALIKIGTPAVLDLVKATQSKNAAVRKYAAYALGKIGGDDAYAAVAKAATDEDALVREQAAAALGIMKDKRALLPLFELIRDRSAKVREEAAHSLGAVGDPRAAKHLIEYGLCDMSPEVARASTQALVELGEPVVEPLIADYPDKPAFARQRILTALTNVGLTAGDKAKQRAAQMQIWVLEKNSEAVDVRQVAAYSLGELEAKDGIGTLIQTLGAAQKSDKDEDKSLAAACRMALGKIYQRYNLPPNY